MSGAPTVAALYEGLHLCNAALVAALVQVHTRQSVLMGLTTHDAFHCGEISLALGINGLGGESPNGPIDMWQGLGRVAE